MSRNTVTERGFAAAMSANSSSRRMDVLSRSSGAPSYGSRYILKRVIDLTISILCLLIFSPILIFTYLFILLKDGRPILYKQTRVGLHGNNFQMFKFRTMKNNSHEQRDELEEVNKKSGPLFKIENDQINSWYWFY